MARSGFWLCHFFGNDIQLGTKGKILSAMAVFSCLNTYLYIKTEFIDMRRNRVRLSESQLHRVIKESVKKVLNETVYGEVGNLPINIGGFIIKTSGEGIVAVSEMDNDHYITLGDSLDTISLQDAIDTISEMLSY